MILIQRYLSHILSIYFQQCIKHFENKNELGLFIIRGCQYFHNLTSYNPQHRISVSTVT